MAKKIKFATAIFSTGFLSFAGVVIETAMNITFPKLMKLFAVSLSQIQWVTTSYLLVLSAMMPLSAFLKKRFSAKKLFVTAALLFLAGVIIDAGSLNLDWLICGRILQGIGTGISLPLMFNLILEQAPPKKMGLLIGLGNFVTATAPAIGPVYGGVLVDTWGWRMIFILMIPVILAALFAGSWAIEQNTKLYPKKFDLLGWLLAALAFSFLITAFSFLASNLKIFSAFLITAILVSLLIGRHYQKSSVPVLNWSVLNHRLFRLFLSCYFIGQFTVLGLSFLEPNLVQLFFKKTSFQAGLTMAPGALVGAIATICGGILFDRLGANKPLLFGIGLQNISLLLFVYFLPKLNILTVTLVYILFAFGQALSMPNLMTSGLQQLEFKQQSDGNALFNTFQQFAGAAGTAVVAAIVSTDKTATKFTGFSFGLFFLLCGLIVDLILLLRSIKLSMGSKNTRLK